MTREQALSAMRRFQSRYMTVVPGFITLDSYHAEGGYLDISLEVWIDKERNCKVAYKVFTAYEFDRLWADFKAVVKKTINDINNSKK